MPVEVSPRDLLALLCLLGALQGVVLAVAVGSLGGRMARANRLIAGIFLGAAAVTTIILVSHGPAGSGGARVWLEFVEFSLWFFAGPLLLVYVALVEARDAWPPPRFALHFAPGLIWLVFASIHWIAHATLPPAPPAIWLMLYQAIYTLLAIGLWQRRLRPQVAGRDSGYGLHGFLVPTVLIVICVQHAAQLVRWTFPNVAQLREVVPLTAAASFVVFTLIGLRKTLPALGAARRRYASSTLSEERARALAQRIETAMERDRLYLEPELTVEALASTLEIPKTHLSQVVNETLGSTFLEYLAAFRVRESMRLLTDDSAQHLTIEAIARRSGFNSRSAFYEAFRRHQGGTPSEFRREAFAE